MRVVRSEFTSRGHLDDAWMATVRVANPSPACSVWIEEQSRTNAGTEVVLGLESPSDSNVAPWFFVASPDGTVLRRGPLADCAGCHAAASHGVFSANEPVTPQR